MTPLYAGLMCTLLLSGTVAGLFGCMSAVRCHRPFVFAICLTIVSLDFCSTGHVAFPAAGKRSALSCAVDGCGAAPHGAQPFFTASIAAQKQAAAFAGFHQGKL